MIKLKFTSGRRLGSTLLVRKLPCTIGSSPECTVVCDDEGVNPEHLVIDRMYGRYVVKSLGGAEVSVNDQLAEDSSLANGDRIRFGGAVITFFSEAAAASGKKRNVSPLQIATVLAILGMLAGQFWLLGAVSMKTRLANIELTAPVQEPDPDSVLAEDQFPGATNVVESVASESDTGTPVTDLNSVETAVEAGEGESDVPPEVEVPIDPTPEEIARITLERTESAYSNALEYVRKRQLGRADSIFSRIQEKNPSYLPVYAERAKIFTATGDYGAAMQQWTELQQRADPIQDADLFDEAVTEKARLVERIRVARRAQTLRQRTPDRPGESVEVSLGRADVQRYLESNEYEELRILTFSLNIDTGGIGLPGSDFQVVTTFYDQSTSGDGVKKTGAIVSEASQSIPGAVDGSRPIELSVSYTVPHGLRASEQTDTGSQFRYSGYSIEVYYRDKLQLKHRSAANIP